MAFVDHAPVLAGAEPIEHLTGNVGILVQHGFTGTTQSMRPVAEALMGAGFSVVAPRLAGHGTSPEDMEGSTYQDWIDSTEAGFTKLREHCSKVFVLGLSMGGTLVTHIAQKFPETAGIILINSVITSDSLKAQFSEATDIPQFLPAIGSDIKRENVVELAYDKTPTKSLGQLVELIDQVNPTLSTISCPALVFSSNEDHVVHPDNQTYYMEHLGSQHKEIVQLENSYHVATLDNDAQEIIEKTLSFIHQFG